MKIYAFKLNVLQTTELSSPEKYVYSDSFKKGKNFYRSLWWETQVLKRKFLSCYSHCQELDQLADLIDCSLLCSQSGASLLIDPTLDNDFMTYKFPSLLLRSMCELQEATCRAGVQAAHPGPCLDIQSGPCPTTCTAPPQNGTSQVSLEPDMQAG